MLQVAKQAEMKQTRKKRDVIRGVARHLPWAAAFFLISIAQLFSMPSPFSVCCLTALLTVDRRSPGAVAGLCRGLAFRVLWGISWDVWQFLACALGYGLFRLPWQSKKQVYLLTGGLLLRTIPGVADTQEMQTILLSAAGFLMGLVSMPALCRAAELLRQRKEQWQQDDVLCMLLPCLVLMAGAARLSAFGVNLGCAVSVFCALTLAYTGGGMAAMCGALACGLALLLGGQGAVMLVVLTFGTLVAGLFRGKARVLAAGRYDRAVCADQGSTEKHVSLSGRLTLCQRCFRTRQAAFRTMNSGSSRFLRVFCS